MFRGAQHISGCSCLPVARREQLNVLHEDCIPVFPLTRRQLQVAAAPAATANVTTGFVSEVQNWLGACSPGVQRDCRGGMLQK